jgi:predicted O-methyltransferase YrrM
MSNPELDFLASLAATHSKILELGSYLGRSTMALADNTSGFVIACDNFHGPKDLVLTWKERQEIYAKFIQNMGEHIASGKVLPWKADHNNLDISQAPKPPKYDLIFIDGSHQPEDVSRDIKFALSVVEAGGTICGHDYYIGSPGVVIAVNEQLGNVEVGKNSRIWFHVCP